MAKMMEVPEGTDMVDVRKRPCERIPVNSPTVKKTMLWSGLKNSRSFLQYTITTVICQVSLAD